MQRNLDELPALWHGAYVEASHGQVFLFGRDGSAQLFSDPDELWLRLMEIASEGGAVKPTARIPEMSSLKPRRDSMDELINQYEAKGGTIKKGPPAKRQSAPKLNLSLADLNL